MPAGTTYEPIATQTISTSVTTLTFSSIPATYTDLVVVVYGGTTSAPDNLWLRFNSDSGSNYSFTELVGTGTAATSPGYANFTLAKLSSTIGGGTTVGQSYIANIMNYSNTTTFKTMINRANQNDNTYPGVAAYTNLWRNTAAINTVLLGRDGAGNLAIGTVMSLYGIKAA
jgi:hypothetical protein